MALVTPPVLASTEPPPGPRLTLLLATRQGDGNLMAILNRLQPACHELGVELVIARAIGEDAPFNGLAVNGAKVLHLPAELSLRELRCRASERIDTDILVVLDDTSELDGPNWSQVLTCRLGAFVHAVDSLDGGGWRERLLAAGAGAPGRSR